MVLSHFDTIYSKWETRYLKWLGCIVKTQTVSCQSSLFTLGLKIIGWIYQQLQCLICRMKQSSHLWLPHLLPLISWFIRIEGDIADYISPRENCWSWVELFTIQVSSNPQFQNTQDLRKSLCTGNNANPFSKDNNWGIYFVVEHSDWMHRIRRMFLISFSCIWAFFFKEEYDPNHSITCHSTAQFTLSCHLEYIAIANWLVRGPASGWVHACKLHG